MLKQIKKHYYYQNEAEQFTFYKIPKLLFTDKRFRDVSAEAKILYGLLLDRIGLSSKNGWVDKENRVFIYFKQEDISDLLGYKRDKVQKLFAELDTEKGIGLIERVRQGQGKPTKIYVMNFVSEQIPEQEKKPCTPEGAEACGKVENHSIPLPKDEISVVQTTEKPTSESRKNRLLEVDKTVTNKTKKNKTDFSDIESSSSARKKVEEDDEEIDALKTDIEYNFFETEMKGQIPIINTLLHIMQTLRNKNLTQYEQLRNKLDSCAIVEFLDEIKTIRFENVRNFSAYLQRVFIEFMTKREIQLSLAV